MTVLATVAARRLSLPLRNRLVVAGAVVAQPLISASSSTPACVATSTTVATASASKTAAIIIAASASTAAVVVVATAAASAACEVRLRFFAPVLLVARSYTDYQRDSGCCTFFGLLDLRCLRPIGCRLAS
ncbi:hypothetical protein PF008_g10427 [Phytophthora fragariae]|uniref:Uncharacterized protein n=1 Tax=Phytophthora fragariae TaxID=53985 RepID=A0A6G0RUB1_9STRA|nr:hypothetical protein PF008_g10427 [Phytophthora fragariae]